MRENKHVFSFRTFVLLTLHLLETTLCLSGDCEWQSFIGPKPELVQFSKALRFIISFTYHSVLSWALD